MIHFFIGRAGTGKTTQILDEIKQELQTNPQGTPIIYLIPEQMTFQVEYDLIKTPNLGGMIRAQVYSFTRLAWRVLQDTGGMVREHITNLGVQMLIRKIVDEKKKELKLFARASEKKGFIEQLETMIVECKRYCISPMQLLEQETIFRDAEAHILADKIHDLAIIYDELQTVLLQTYVESEDYLRLLAEKISKSDYLKEAEIYVDGFHHFTPQEYEVLKQLMIYAKRVTFALTVDNSSNKGELFHLTQNTFATLKQLALEQDISTETIEVFQENHRHVKNSALAFLESHFNSYSPPIYQGKERGIVIYEATNRKAEIDGVVREIRKLAQSGVRYNEIAVLVRNPQDYEFASSFDNAEIPFFIDEKQPMVHHPLIEFIRAALEAVTTNWRYDTMFRAIKTDFFAPLVANIEVVYEEVDILENYVLMCGIHGTRWTSNWKYQRSPLLDSFQVPQTDEEKEIEDILNVWRERISTPLLILQKNLKKSTGREKCVAVYEFLEHLQIPEKIERIKQEAKKHGNLREVRQHEQVWNTIIQLLDEYVALLGDTKISVKAFCEVLDAGMQAMSFALVPPAIDQVLIANFDRSRLLHIQYAFVIGVNERIIPKKIVESGILTDTDREKLLQANVTLGVTSRDRLLDETFAIYIALTTPAKRLYVSYPMSGNDKEGTTPSPLIKMLTTMFPNKIGFWSEQPNSTDATEYVTNPRSTLSVLAKQLDYWKRNDGINNIWWSVYDFFAISEVWKQSAQRVLSGLAYENKNEMLDKSLREQLYGKNITTSVSQMEKFQTCPFSYFMQYGLRLRERKVFKLESLDIGNLFHMALKHISEEVKAKNLDWSSLTYEQCKNLTEVAVSEIAPLLQQNILFSSKRQEYVKQKLQNIILRTTFVLSQHAKTSGFAPVDFELKFGKNGRLPALSIVLPDGTKMELVGQIDRVDYAENEDGVFLRVIDYKSGKKDMDWTEVFYGLTLQMLTYLEVVITHAEDLIGKEASPAGVLYFHMHNPMIKGTGQLEDDVLEQKLLESFKMTGLLLDDVEVTKLMDETLEPLKSSKIVPARVNKDGTLGASKARISDEHFALLSNHVRHTFKKIGTQVVEGVVSVTPYKIAGKNGCQYCSFQAICQFDESLPENNYCEIEKETKKTVLELLGGSSYVEAKANNKPMDR